MRNSGHIIFDRLASGAVAPTTSGVTKFVIADEDGLLSIVALTGTANRITYSSGVFDISSSYVGQTSIITIGTITTGTWHGTAIGTAYGGVPSGGTSGYVLKKNSGTDYDYSWAVDATGGGSGVTSVGLAHVGGNGGAITIGNTPITTSGNLTLTWNGTSSDYITGQGNVVAFPTLFVKTDLSAIAPLSYNNSTGVFTTSMATNKLIGRGTAGTGVMEEITIGSGLTLTGTTLSASGSSGTVTSVTPSDGNGFDITITNTTTTPVISITTTLTDKHIGYSNSGALTGSSSFTWDNSIKRLEVTGLTYSHNTQASIPVTGAQSVYSVSNFTVPASTTFSAGATINSVYAQMDYTFAGNSTIANSGIHSAEFSFIKLISSSTGTVVTVSQGTSTKRSISAHILQVHLPTGSTGTIDYVSQLELRGFYQDSGTTTAVTITNAYGLLIPKLDENMQVANLTNKYAIWQDGVNDQNYFAGNLINGKLTGTGNRVLGASATGGITIISQSEGSVWGRVSSGTGGTEEVKSWVVVSSDTSGGSNVASLSITDFATWYSTYRHFKLIVYGLHSRTNSLVLNMRSSTDGSTFASGANSYSYRYDYGASINQAAGTGTEVQVIDFASSTSTSAVDLEITFSNPSQSTYHNKWRIVGMQTNTSNESSQIDGVGIRLSAAVLRGFLFWFGTLNTNNLDYQGWTLWACKN